MFIIKIGNSRSYLTPKLPRDIEWEILKNTCYKDESKYFRVKNWKLCIENLFNQEDYSFPTGLTRRVCQILHKYGINYRIEDSRKIPQRGYRKFSTKIDEPTAYPDQVGAHRALTESPSGRGICVLPTGVGKTRVMKDVVQTLGMNTLIIEPGVNLKHQVCDYFAACFGDQNVDLYHKQGKLSPITVANLDALENASPERLAEFDCVIFDEYHHEACVTAREINERVISSIYHKYAFTATNFRNNKNEQVLLESVLANEVYSITPLEAIARNYILPINYHREDIPDQLPDLGHCGPFPPSEAELQDMWERKKASLPYHKAYKQFISENERRNEAIIHQAQALKEERIPTLILVKEIAHGQALQNEISDALFVNGTETKEFNSDILNAFNREEVPILIGTSVIGEGIDTKPAGAVILGSGEKAESKIMQNIGRVVRRYPGQSRGLVYDYNDLGHSVAEKHSKARKRVVTKYFGKKAII